MDCMDRVLMPADAQAVVKDALKKWKWTLTAQILPPNILPQLVSNRLVLLEVAGSMIYTRNRHRIPSV